MACSSSRNLGLRYINSLSSLPSLTSLSSLSSPDSADSLDSIDSLDYSELRVDQELRRHDHRHEKPRERVEQVDPRLLVNVGDMPEVPGHQQVGFVHRRQRDVQRVA